jgi:hypothetical protein
MAGCIVLFYSCHPAKKIQAVIPRADTTTVQVSVSTERARKDSIEFIKETYAKLGRKHIDFITFNAKLDVDYEDNEGKKTDVNAHLRMYRDSLIWISLTGPLGIEGLRVLVDRDSVRMLDKQNKIYTVRSIPFLQELTALPLDLASLQDLIIGNPVFLDPIILSYTKQENSITLQSNTDVFKNLLTIDAAKFYPLTSKLDDLDPQRNRTCYLLYSDYEDKKLVNFSTKRIIQVSEKKKVNIKLDFKQYDFNEKLSFSFSVPKNYERN